MKPESEEPEESAEEEAQGEGNEIELEVEIPGQIDESSIKPPPDFPDDEEDGGTPVQMTLF